MTVPYSFSFTTAFTQPEQIVSMLIDEDTEAIALVATWDESGDDFHEEYLVEAQTGDGEWAEVGRTTNETFTYYLTPLNQDVRMRVSDSNGSQYSEPLEEVGNLTFARWAMTHVDGNDDFIHELRYVRPSSTTDMPLDTTMLQPLSEPDGTGRLNDTQFPIVFVGQFQGERIHFAVHLSPEDASMIDVFRRAALEPQGNIALKDPKGPVYIVQLAGFTKTDLGAGHRMIEFDGIQIA